MKKAELDDYYLYKEMFGISRFIIEPERTPKKRKTMDEIWSATVTKAMNELNKNAK